MKLYINLKRSILSVFVKIKAKHSSRAFLRCLISLRLVPETDFRCIYSQDFQKEVVKAAEVFTAIGYKHIEAGRNLLFVISDI